MRLMRFLTTNMNLFLLSTTPYPLSTSPGLRSGHRMVNLVLYHNVSFGKNLKQHMNNMYVGTRLASEARRCRCLVCEEVVFQCPVRVPRVVQEPPMETLLVAVAHPAVLQQVGDRMLGFTICKFATEFLHLVGAKVWNLQPTPSTAIRA